MQTRYDFEFMERPFSFGAHRLYERPGRLHRDGYPPYRPRQSRKSREPMPKQTRYDLEFMAELLGRFSGDGLVSAVAEGMADPFWNERAQRRIATMLRALPDRRTAFPRMGATIRDEYHRKAPFRGAAEPARELDTRATFRDLPAPLRQSKQPVESILTQRGFVSV